ncbi:MAG: GNAT family N-acetyltransferase [Parvularculaceae bacterium]
MSDEKQEANDVSVDALSARTVASITDIPAKDWNALAAPSPCTANPFVSHEFLYALEASGSAIAETGWAPVHILIERHGEIAAAAPAYLKSHSYGEYVFDHHWADAFERVGGRYYPKVLCASPFTPVSGPRLLTRDKSLKPVLADTFLSLMRAAGSNTTHLNFLNDTDAAILEEQGFLLRRGIQYHWFNRGYSSFDEFLSALASRKRKAIRRERRDAVEGVTIHKLTGAEITEDALDAFWGFYQDTGARKWGRPYLTRSFFSFAADLMRDRMLLVIAKSEGRSIAGALNFIGGDALYGRYWGCLEDRPFLHFELCYYQAIDFAIENGLARVEAGAQGEHKIARGYEPVLTTSAHWIENLQLRKAVARAILAESGHVRAEAGALAEYVPYRKGE